MSDTFNKKAREIVVEYCSSARLDRNSVLQYQISAALQEAFNAGKESVLEQFPSDKEIVAWAASLKDCEGDYAFICAYDFIKARMVG